jgi:hypothetical protein
MEKIGENMLFSFGVPPFGNCIFENISNHEKIVRCN